MPAASAAAISSIISARASAASSASIGLPLPGTRPVSDPSCAELIQNSRIWSPQQLTHARREEGSSSRRVLPRHNQRTRGATQEDPVNVEETSHEDRAQARGQRRGTRPEPSAAARTFPAPPTIPPATRDDRSRKLERDLTAPSPTPANAVRGGPQGSHSQTPADLARGTTDNLVQNSFQLNPDAKDDKGSKEEASASTSEQRKNVQASTRRHVGPSGVGKGTLIVWSADFPGASASASRTPPAREARLRGRSALQLCPESRHGSRHRGGQVPRVRARSREHLRDLPRRRGGCRAEGSGVRPRHRRPGSRDCQEVQPRRGLRLRLPAEHGGARGSAPRPGHRKGGVDPEEAANAAGRWPRRRSRVSLSSSTTI